MVFTSVQRLFQSFKHSKEPIFNIVKRFVAGDMDLNVTAPTSSPPQLYRGIERENPEEIGRYLKIPHVLIISGVRRSGKSTLLTQIMSEWLNKPLY